MTDSFIDNLNQAQSLANRFRGFLPVVIDVETGGFEASQHALLEIAAVTLEMNDEGQLCRQETVSAAVLPHPDLVVEQSALDFTGIDLNDPGRQAIPEKEALRQVFEKVRLGVRENDCTRAVVVAHNAHS